MPREASDLDAASTNAMAGPSAKRTFTAGLSRTPARLVALDAGEVGQAPEFARGGRVADQKTLGSQQRAPLQPLGIVGQFQSHSAADAQQIGDRPRRTAMIAAKTSTNEKRVSGQTTSRSAAFRIWPRPPRRP